MKILYIANSIVGSGGLERVLSVKCSYLSDHLDYEVFIFSLNEPKAVPFYEFSPNVKFQSCDVNGKRIKYLTSYVHAIRSIVKNIHPDIILVCDDGFKAFFLPLILGKKTPLIYERHASVQLNYSNRELTTRYHLMHVLMQRLGSRFNKFVVLTKGNLKEWNSANLKVIPNPLSFYPNNSSLLENKQVIVVGSHSDTKGYDLLLCAWKEVISVYPAWSLHIYGKVDKEKKYLKLATDLDLEKHVVFFPPSTQIEQAYLDSSIIVLSSRSEGFGMVLIEAMACGLPCVAFDCPHGPADIITNREDGILVPNGDVEQLAIAIMELIENEPLRKKMGAKAKENVKRYLPEQIMPLWDDLFQQLVHANRL